VGIERLGDRRLEELLLALEVVVEGTHSHIGRLRDFQDGHIDLVRGNEALRRLDQRGSRALFASLEAVDRRLRLLTHPSKVAEFLTFDDFVRTT
jgi:hypothetical protein